MLDLVIDLLMPTGLPSRKRREKQDPDTIPVEVQVPGAFTRALNESGELDEQAIAVGVLRQGKQHSVLALVSGLALLEVLRPRRSRSLPREFALAVTQHRVVAFAMSLWAEGTDTTTTLVRIKRGERGSWPRELVQIVDPSRNILQNGATLEVAGERIPVVWESHSSTDELVGALSG
jgi:hypothetical protein